MTSQTTKIDWNNPSAKISRYFSVIEVTKGQKARIPQSGSMVELNILRLARELDKIRSDWNAPILVTSWYRPRAIEIAAGRSGNSQHTRGLAADIRPVNAGDLVRFQKFVDDNWYGALGYGAARGFVHVDLRNGKGWETGGTKGVRWDYL